MQTFTATYSPEDNKLRLYSDERLDDELYQKAKELGFRWAPKQELFVAPAWSPQREDFLLGLAGDIDLEETSLAERAEAKAERLAGIAGRANENSSRYVQAAKAIGERFYMGQPILVGHHSEAKARRDQKAMDSNMEKAVSEVERANYWEYRAQGVLANVNRKGRTRTTENRIKKLLAEMRGFQRRINHGFKIVKIAEMMKAIVDPDEKLKHFERWCGAFSNDGSFTPRGMSESYRKGEISVETGIEQMMAYGLLMTQNTSYFRWIEHLLNRISYEQSNLLEVPLYVGTLTPGMVQTFFRTQGAESPKAKLNGEIWTIKDEFYFPYHLTDGVEEREIVIHDEELRKLFVELGYAISNKPKKPTIPLLNLNVDEVTVQNRWSTGTKTLKKKEMTKAEYKDWYSEWKGTILLEGFKAKVRIVYEYHGGMGKRDEWLVFLTDSKEHPMPEE